MEKIRSIIHLLPAKAYVSAFVLAILVLPLVAGNYWTQVFGDIGIYIMLGIGLNVVVGFAGLLDLGYVAFFAIGSYTYALLASRSSASTYLSGSCSRDASLSLPEEGRCSGFPYFG